MNKNGKQKDIILSAMSTDSPSLLLLNKAKVRLAEDNPPAKLRRRFWLRFALAGAPVLVVCIVLSLLFTVILPGGAKGCGASKVSSDMASESVDPYNKNNVAPTMPNPAESDEYVGFSMTCVAEVTDFPEIYSTYISSLTEMSYNYYQDSTGKWHAVTDYENDMYLVITGRGTEQELLLLLENYGNKPEE